LNIKIVKTNSSRFYYNNLYRDYIFNFDKVSKYYQYDYRVIDSYRERLKDINASYNHRLRPKICSILEEYNRRLDCSQKTIENINNLKDKNSIVVIGGQQPGLLTGPIFIIYKILTVLKVSSFLEDKLKVRAVPCFWNASDDSSLDQVNSLKILNNDLDKIVLNLSDVIQGTRYSNFFLPSCSLKKVINDLENVLKSTDFKGAITNFLNECLNTAANSSSKDDKNVSISSFFSIIISRMFSDYGLVVIDPASEELKSLSYWLLKYDINNYQEINNLVSSAGIKLKENGYHAQLNSIPETLNFFWNISGVRKKIISDRKNYFKIANRRFKKEELISYIEKNIEKASLNVVLRPIFQDGVLPVMCCVCGPGEVSYFAQLKEIYNLMNIKMPVIYPRFSATIVEKKIKKVLNKLKVAYGDLSLNKGKLSRKIVGEKLNLDLDKLILELENDVMVKIEKLEKNISNYGMNIYSSFDRIKRNIRKEISVLEKKLYSEYKNQNKYIFEGLDKIYNNLLPGDNLQERELNVWGYINKYDFDFINCLYLKFEPLDFSHKFIEIL